MKNNRLFSIVLTLAIIMGLWVALPTQVARATTITEWCFGDSTLTLTPTTGSGTATAGSGLTPSSGTGNLTPRCLSGQAWNNSGWTTNTAIDPNDYYEFAVSTVGMRDIRFEFDYRRSSTGPTMMEFHYSTDGSAFTSFGTYSLPATAFSNNAMVVIDLSSISALNNNANAKFRIYGYSAGASAGTLRVDNVRVDNQVKTWNTISLDGTVYNSEWGSGILGTVNGTQFGITWDDDYWYFSAKGGLTSSDYFMVGIDIDPTNNTTNTGGTAGRCGATFPAENKPDYILVQRQNSYTRESWGWNSGWDQSAWNPSETSEYDFSGSNTDYEVKLKKSTVFSTNEDTSPIGFYLWLSNGACEYFNAWPPENYNGWTSGTPSRFLYTHTGFATTDANRTPVYYGSRSGWDAQTLSANSTAYNFFGGDDASAGNPWLRMTTTAAGAGGASCVVRARLVGNNAFAGTTFIGINRYIDFNLTECTNLDVDVRMRYEYYDLRMVNEFNTLFYRCAAVPCSGAWTAVSGGTTSRDTTNHWLNITSVPQTQFSYWTISDNNIPTVIELRDLTVQNNIKISFALVSVLAGVLILGGGLLIWRRRNL